ncbi:MAG: WD40/YVTN/BNR-like repeat-containing protein [Deltaproteobacteria bacterium]
MKRVLPCIALLAAAGLARADGAFPTEMGVFFPPAQPSLVVIAANIGLLVSADGAQTFDYVCEQPAISPVGINVNLYQVSDQGTILADTGAGIVRSADGACTWTASGGALANVPVVDAAFDPMNPGTVMALASPSAGTAAVNVSTDDGQTFGPPVWSGSALLSGVEFSRAQAGRVYVTGNWACPETGSAFAMRSDDEGQSWTSFDLSALGDVVVRIAQVDPTDPATVYFRVTSLQGQGDWLAITHDSAATVQPSLHLVNTMTAFLRAADGTLYVGTNRDELFTLAPGQTTWQRAAGGPHLKALAEANGTLWACGDNYADKMVLGKSTDGAQTFCPVFAFSQMAGMPSCQNIQTQCQTSWSQEQQFFKVTGPGDAGTPCLAEAPDGSYATGTDPFPAGDAGACDLTAAQDGGLAGGDGGAAAPDAGLADAGSSDAGTVAPVDGGPLRGPPPHVTPAAGCGCGASGGEGLLGALLFGLALAFWGRRRAEG